MRKITGVLAFLSVITVLLSCAKSPDTAARDEAVLKNAAFSSLIGIKVPAMELDAFHRGEIGKIRLSDYRKKWLVLFFYPADFTFVCPTELREMSEYYGQFRKAGAEIVSVSTDSAYVHRAWSEANEDIKKIPYAMGSDRAGKLSKALGVYDESEGVSRRASFVVDPEGKIVAYEVHDESIGRSTPELLRKLQAAIAVRNDNGGFCPASWKPGDEMVVPK